MLPADWGLEIAKYTHTSKFLLVKEKPSVYQSIQLTCFTHMLYSHALPNLASVDLFPCRIFGIEFNLNLTGKQRHNLLLVSIELFCKCGTLKYSFINSFIYTLSAFPVPKQMFKAASTV